MAVAMENFLAKRVEFQVALRQIDLRHLNRLLLFIVELEVASEVLLGPIVSSQPRLACCAQCLSVVFKRFEDRSVSAAHPFGDGLLQPFERDFGALVIVLP